MARKASKKSIHNPSTLTERKVISMEKKKYIVPEINAMQIADCDIITTSGTPGDPLNINNPSGTGGEAEW